MGLQDAIILARELKSALETGNKSSASSQSLTAAPAKALADALQRYEKERSSRVLPITIRSFLMGSLLQIPLPVVTPASQSPVNVLSNTFMPVLYIAKASM